MIQRMTESTARSVGVVGALLALGLVLWSGWTTVASAGRHRLAASVFVLSAFSLTFAANTAVGRLCLGYEAGHAGRYVPYMMPLVMAGYLFIALLPSLQRIRPVLIIAFLALLAVKETVLVHHALVEPRHFARLKVSFRKCYFANPNVAACSVRWPLHPNPVGSKIQEKLDYLRDHRLGLYREAAR